VHRAVLPPSQLKDSPPEATTPTEYAPSYVLAFAFLLMDSI
jgi:hypothetical protein